MSSKSCISEWPPVKSEQTAMEEHGVFKIKDIKSPLLHDYNKEVCNYFCTVVSFAAVN